MWLVKVVNPTCAVQPILTEQGGWSFLTKRYRLSILPAMQPILTVQCKQSVLTGHFFKVLSTTLCQSDTSVLCSKELCPVPRSLGFSYAELLTVSDSAVRCPTALAR